MNKNIVLLLLFVLFFLFSFKDSNAVNTKGFQYWQINSGSYKANEYWSLTAEDEFRMGNQFCYNNVDMGMVFYGIGDWIDVSI